MTKEEPDRLKQKLADAVARHGLGAKVAIVGWTAIAFDIAREPVVSSGAAQLLGLFGTSGAGALPSLSALDSTPVDIIVIAEDVDKEWLLDLLAGRVPLTTHPTLRDVHLCKPETQALRVSNPNMGAGACGLVTPYHAAMG